MIMKLLGLSAIDIKDYVDDHEPFGPSFEPFNDYNFMLPFRKENGKQSFLVKEWNGSKEQKLFLQKIYKNRKITWGDSISKAKSKTKTTALVNGILTEIPSISKFASQNNLNAATLRLAYKQKRVCVSKGITVEFIY